MMPRYEILEHPSDIGLRANGKSIEEMFRNAAEGLMYIIAGESVIKGCWERTISIRGTDPENLMVKWLAELLFLFDAGNFLTAGMDIVSIGETFLEAKLTGEIFDEKKHELKTGVKAVTYHQLKIENTGELWQATVFLDI
jgi:SHS2 domain-containing protein